MYEFKMPILGAEMTHGKLIEWKIKVGDQVKRHDIIAVIDTDKAAIEVESFGEGIVEKLLTNIGESVPVGTVMAIIHEPGEKIISPKEHIATVPSLKISPLARKLATQLGVDVSKVKGTGPGGAIVEDDIRKSASGGSVMEDHALSMRKVIAAAMSRSKREIPHYYLSNEMDMNSALTWLGQYNSSRSVTDRLVYVVLLIKAVVNTLKEFPEFNGYFINNEYKPSASIHIGMAISLRGGGLIAPALLNTDKMNLVEIMTNLNDLVCRTRSGKLKGGEISDSTITITNLGELGVDSVFGVIYPPQVALIGFGKISSHKTLIATLAADHRITNGLLGSRFLSTLNQFLQEPEKL